MFFLLVVRGRAALSSGLRNTDTGLVNAQHGALFGTDFINNRGHVGPLDRGQNTPRKINNNGVPLNPIPASSKLNGLPGPAACPFGHGCGRTEGALATNSFAERDLCLPLPLSVSVVAA